MTAQRAADGGRAALLSMPVLRIAYSERDDVVSVTPGDVFGNMHPEVGRIMQHKNLPTLLFQLVDKGYRVARDPEEQKGQVVVWAFSPEYVRRVEGW